MKKNIDHKTMKSRISKADIARNISRELGVNYKRSKDIFNVIIEIISHNLHEGNPIKIRNFGNFSIKSRPQRQYYNPITKKKELSKKKNAIQFRASSKLFKKGIVEESLYLSFPNLKDLGFKNYRLPSSTQNSNKLCSSDFSYKPTDENKLHQVIQLKELSGNIILPNRLNRGVRIKSNTSKVSDIQLKHIGVVRNENYDVCNTETYQYPYFAQPVNGTPILKFIKYQGGTGGVTEPLLFHKLMEFKDIEKSLEILQNTSLPIRNRNYGYKPDIAIIWKDKNINIDVEIDEPYDIVTRKPIHYKSNADNLRNAYFLDNGWYVIRVTEQQIVENLSEVKNFISEMICDLANDIRFYKNQELTKSKRWSYEEAKEMEQNCFREKLLKLDVSDKPIMQTTFDNEYNTTENFLFVKPDNDIIENRYIQLQNAIKTASTKYKYLVFESTNLQYDYVCNSNDIVYTNENFEHGIKLLDTIEQKEYFIPYKEIHSFDGTETLFKETKYDNNNLNVREALIERNPIKITYTNSEGDTSDRNVIFICPWYTQIFSDENKKTVAKEILLDYATTYIFEFATLNSNVQYFCGYCTKRNEIRTFNVNRINKLQVYKCRKPGHIFNNSSLWKYLEEDLGKEAELMFNYLPEREKNKLLYIGNLCNALVMQNKLDEAMDIYTNHQKTEIVYNGKNWHDACLEDIEYFEEKSKFKENFTEMKKILKSKGW